MSHDRSVAYYLENMDAYIPVDVRSPSEFQDSRIPNAINIPLFTDSERAEIGTIYKNIGKREAKWRAMELVSPKLPLMLGEIKDLEASGKQPLLYCWRGGMRSQSVFLFANLSGLNIDRLEGGYRAYREVIVKKIPELIPEKAVVVYGMTGTGKTDILKSLKESGYPVLDLEEYANHKGSVFGAIGGQPPHNQKMFDALLFDDLLKIEGSKYFFMEGESKRIGHAVQPPELYEKKNNGIHIRVVSSLEKRVERIYEQYVLESTESEEFHQRVSVALNTIVKRVKPLEIQKELLHCLEERNYKEIIRLLIVYYYDPRYDNKSSEFLGTDLEVNSDSIEEATKRIAAFVDEKIHSRQI